MTLKDEIDASVRAIRDLACHFEPEIALVLGSGLGAVAQEAAPGAVRIPFARIPHFGQAAVAGHAGELVLGEFAGRRVAIYSGRFHAYEGHPPARLAHPVRVAARLGATRLVVTNAAGGVRPDLAPGNLMLIEDHIDNMRASPLVGPNEDSLGPRFPDMSEAYSHRLRALALEAARSLGIRLATGVYLANLGPAYETPAEIRSMRFLGADAVGMSTIPEVVAARHLGLEVLGISLITNRAAGTGGSGPLSHDEVIETGQVARSNLVRLLAAAIPGM